MITDIPGIRVGHWTDEAACTGCTVVLFPEETIASGEVRGGAPATREFDLLRPGRLVQHVDAVLLTGGSAFGLAAADGVMHWHEERGRGFPTSVGAVPIVVAMALYDLGTGDSGIRPGPAEGFAACESAHAGEVVAGRAGAGAGATIGKLWGDPRPGGLGTASVRDGHLVVGALVAVNAVGDVLGPDGEPRPLPPFPAEGAPGPFESTTVGVVATNAALDKTACLTVAQGAHDGIARVLDPPHTVFDGDAVVAASVPGESVETVEAPADRVRALAVRTFAAAIRAAVSPGAAAGPPH